MNWRDVDSFIEKWALEFPTILAGVVAKHIYTNFMEGWKQ